MEIKRINPETELRDGFLVSEKRKSIWNAELDLMQNLLDVCERHGLTIWLCGGSLLGAVRHKGFIPWDDDMDLLMPRPDYDKLLEIGSKEFKEPYFFQSAYTDKSYWRFFSRLRKSDTTAIYPGEINIDMNQGIFIDIFPCDGVEDDTSMFENRIMSIDRIKRFLRYERFSLPADRTFLKYVYQYVISRPLFRKGKMQVYKEAESLLKSCDFGKNMKSGEISLVRSSLALYKKLLFPSSIFNGTEYLYFEGIRVPVMKGYQEYLKIHYGDYMKPVRSRTLHGSLIFDADKPYEDYIPLLRKEHSFFKDLVRKIVKEFLHKKVRPLVEDELIRL